MSASVTTSASSPLPRLRGTRLLLSLFCLLVGGAGLAQAADEVPVVQTLGHGTNFVYVTVVQGPTLSDATANPNAGKPLSGGPYVYTWSYGSGGATAGTYVFPRNNTIEAQTTRIVFINPAAAQGDVIAVDVRTQSGQQVATVNYTMPAGPDYTFDVSDVTGGNISPAGAGMLRGTEMAYSVVATTAGGSVANVAVDWSIVPSATSGMGTFFDDNSIVGNGRLFASSAGADPAEVRATFIGTAQTAVTPVTITEPGAGGVVITASPWADAAVVDMANQPTGTTGVHVRAQDNQQETNLRYSWSATSFRPYAGAPVTDAPPVTFLPNGNNQAKDSVVTFRYPGLYTLSVSAFDADGNTSPVQTLSVVVVNSGNANNIARISLSPGTQSLSSWLPANITASYFNAAGTNISDLAEVGALANVSTRVNGTGVASVAVGGANTTLTVSDFVGQAPSTLTVLLNSGVVHPWGPVEASADVQFIQGTLNPTIQSLVTDVADYLLLAGDPSTATTTITARVREDSPTSKWAYEWSVSGYADHVGATFTAAIPAGAVSFTYTTEANNPRGLNAPTATVPATDLVYTLVNDLTVNAAGVYRVQLRMTDSDGNVATETIDVVAVSAPTSVAFSPATAAVAEQDETHQVLVSITRSGNPIGAVEVPYTIGGGSAVQGVDYNPALVGDLSTVAPSSGTLRWNAGDAAVKTIPVNVLGNTAPEGNRTVQISLGSAQGFGDTVSAGVFTLTINDDDGNEPTTTGRRIILDPLTLNGYEWQVRLPSTAEITNADNSGRQWVYDTTGAVRTRVSPAVPWSNQ